MWEKWSLIVHGVELSQHGLKFEVSEFLWFVMIYPHDSTCTWKHTHTLSLSLQIYIYIYICIYIYIWRFPRIGIPPKTPKSSMLDWDFPFWIIKFWIWKAHTYVPCHIYCGHSYKFELGVSWRTSRKDPTVSLLSNLSCLHQDESMYSYMCKHALWYTYNYN